jgi:hypothetical protein
MKGKAEQDINYLFQRLLDSWEHLPVDYVYSCIGSMQTRCQAVIDANG